MSEDPEGPDRPDEPTDEEQVEETHVEEEETHVEEETHLETTGEEYEEIHEEELEEIEGREESDGLYARTKRRIGNVREKYFTADPDSENWGDQPVFGNTSRRGVLTGIGGLAAGAFALSEATDRDGWAIDLEPGEFEEQPPIGGGAPEDEGAQNGTDGETPAAAAVDISNPEQYAFETEQELIDETGFCYPGEADVYIGAVDASEVQEMFDEGSFNGDDPTGALSFEEVEMELSDITAHQNMYAVDVDRKQGNNGDYDLFVQLVGEEDGGMYVTRKGAAQVSNLDFEEVFEGYHVCN